VSDYEWLVELAGKGLAERDSHPMPKSVTTPEGFYEVMARAALDAIGLPALLEETARAEQELKITDETHTQDVNADAATTLFDGPPVSPRHAMSEPPATHNGCENGVEDTGSRRERGTGKAENARLRRKWATTAEERLAGVTAAVERLRKVFDIEREMPSEAFAEVASAVVNACCSLAEWLSSTRVPRGLAKAEGELGAAARVYWNAAIAFRSLGDEDEYQRQSRSNACATLLKQGDFHVETFVAGLAKKLRDDVAVERRSTGSKTSDGPFP